MLITFRGFSKTVRGEPRFEAPFWAGKPWRGSSAPTAPSGLSEFTQGLETDSLLKSPESPAPPRRRYAPQWDSPNKSHLFPAIGCTRRPPTFSKNPRVETSAVARDLRHHLSSRSASTPREQTLIRSALQISKVVLKHGRKVLIALA
ncbi:hypothetical protein SKAU_G00392530 [Synaphobranchus kaupii]|uniref:Uncharacterized protein n=1 Tax=Synaphobranchus kaupii TaxID=118154 RepID=A0A9Q1IDS3_SYNKA|nr:hypothetical protein SKAU_G00392530 [Synaphobranchus kaupii]